MSSKSPQSKYNRAHTLVVEFVAMNRHRCGPDNWSYLGHLIWCETRHNPPFLSAVVRVACFQVARLALAGMLSPLTLTPED